MSIWSAVSTTPINQQKNHTGDFKLVQGFVTLSFKNPQCVPYVCTKTITYLTFTHFRDDGGVNCNTGMLMTYRPTRGYMQMSIIILMSIHSPGMHGEIIIVMRPCASYGDIYEQYGGKS